LLTRYNAADIPAFISTSISQRSKSGTATAFNTFKTSQMRIDQLDFGR
jgi:hypothetical protein